MYGVSGYPQPQASWVLSAIGSSNTSWAFFLVGRDYQLPVVQRLFLDPWFSASAPRDIRAYRDGNPDFPHEQAGSNDSATARLRQQVLAFNFWTADTLTWQERTTASGRTVFDRPPSFAGATLGGLFRMRGFEAARFNDRTAIYYALEYRVIPAWNPFAEKVLFKRIRIDWLQGVLFAEAGRVADQWSLSKLHREMKWDVGLGIRAYVNRIVVRIDIAGSAEGVGVQMLVAQAF